MLRIKSILALMVLAFIAGLIPSAQGQTLQVVIAGASSSWQALALGAYNAGNGVSGAVPPLFHWTSASNAVNLTDTRPTPVNNDPGTLWVVWDSATPNPNVWVFVKTEAIGGIRCYFAQPHCNVNATSSVLSAAGAGQITLPAPVWGADTNLPGSIQALFTAGQFVNVAASVERPEDAAFTLARVNSKLGASTVGGAASDGLDGLGYNANNPPGVNAPYPIGNTGKGVASPILSGYPGSSGLSTIVAFNITGKDPFSGTVVPAGYTVVNLGASPLIFVTERDKGQLTKLTNATEAQLQQVFSGTNCDASAFGLPSGGINIFLREPNSGAADAAESLVFRRATAYPDPVLGLSQEANVNGPVNNPLKGQAGTCLSGAGARYRAIGNSEEVKAVLNSASKFGGTDGIGYTFFSYGNVSSIASNPNYGYVQLNGVDPIFASYKAGNSIDPGQPAVAGELPGVANLPASCAGAFPCSEAAIWKNGFSFPNLRNGTYRAWSILRLISSGTALVNVKTLVATSNQFVVTSVPDYVPPVPVTVGGITDVGLKLLRSHYIQRNGNGLQIGPAGAATNIPEKGGDLGGGIIPTTIGVTTEKQTQLIQSSDADGGVGPVLRQ